MLRTIKTELFFSPSDFRDTGSIKGNSRDLSLSFTWIKLAPFEYDINPYIVFREINGSVEFHREKLDRHVLGGFLRLILDETATRSKYPTQIYADFDADYIENQIIGEILNLYIVIENSPPRRMRVSTLASKGTGVAIGTFIGTGLAGGQFPLMLVTVPLGIVVVGSAIGIARGLENGLGRAVQRMIEKRL